MPAVPPLLTLDPLTPPDERPPAEPGAPLLPAIPVPAAPAAAMAAPAPALAPAPAPADPIVAWPATVDDMPLDPPGERASPLSQELSGKTKMTAVRARLRP